MTQSVSVETTVFQSGNSQAVRIPKGFRFDCDRVWISKVGDSLTISPANLSAMDVLDALTSDMPNGWADGFDEPADHDPEAVPVWE